MLSRIVKMSPGTFRLILAIFVVVFHAVSFLSFGHAVVYMFFVLSGYWIFKMYEEKYSKFDNAYWVYIRSRLLRLYPMYWVVLLFSLICYFIIPEIWDKVLVNSKNGLVLNVFSNFLVIGNDIINKFWFIGSAWSLTVELQFYIIVPFLTVLINKKNSFIYLLV